MAFENISTVQSQESVLATNKVLRNTYTLLALTLVFSAVTAGIAMATNARPIGIIGMLIGFYGLMFLVHKTQNSIWGLPSVFAFTGFLGYTLGPILNYFLASSAGTELVMTALGGTGLIFFALSGYVLTTKKDMSFMTGMLGAGFIVLLLMVVANIFMQIPALSLAISGLFILFSSGVILYQTSEIIHGGERNYISATVTLYVSLYNIFLSLLQLLQAFSGDD
jgi:modulator of FtsH protease